MKRFIKPLLIVAVLLFAAAGINNIVSTENKVRFKEVELKSTTSELKQLQLDYDSNLKKQDDLLHEKNVNQAELEKVRQENEQLKQRTQELEKQVSIKREAAIAASRLTTGATAYAAGGNKDTWLAASGIPASEWWAVDYIVSRESGWQPCAYYPSKNDCNANPSSACGLAQSLPCGKQAKYGHWTDPVANLKWQYEYVKGRYGGYPQAVAYWQANRHY